MDARELELLRRLESFRFDPPHASKTFADRLVRENGWTRTFALRAIEEYRRFVFLFVATDQPVSPSTIIDQVWHEHLLYTRAYWDDFCPNVLGRPLHHEPSSGLAGQDDQFAVQFEQTLANYRRYFGEPPADIWMTKPKKRRSVYRRIDTAAHLIVPRSIVRTMLAITVASILLILFLCVQLTIRNSNRGEDHESAESSRPGVSQPVFSAAGDRDHRRDRAPRADSPIR